MDSRNPMFRRNGWQSSPHSIPYIKPQRYSLLEARPPISSFNNGMRDSPLKHTMTGPLLASTPISYNLSTYMDSKSPGLSERVVQYNNENQECRSTHQKKYGSAGVFPVVHLFKKNLPIRTVSPSKVTMHMTLQESTTQNNMESINTADNITQQLADNRTHHDTQETSIGTHSVLDALKEISRKRIHSGDECLQPNSYKRHRKDCYIDSTDTKNYGEKISSNINMGKNPVQLSDVPCVVNDIAASLTSTSGYTVPPKSQIKEVVTRKIEDKKLQNHVETQTDDSLLKHNDNKLKDNKNKLEDRYKISEKHSTTSMKGSSDGTKDIYTEDNESYTESTMVRRYDDPVFEKITKDRLAKVLGYKVPILSKNVIDEKEESLHFEIKPASIISPHNKPKHNKHVTFDIPEKENAFNNSVENKNIESTSTVNISTSATEFNETTSKASEETVNPIGNKHTSCDGKKERSNESTSNIPIFFDHTTISKVLETPFHVEQISNKINAKEHKAIITSEVPSAVALPSVTSSSKLGGFKFDFQNHNPIQSKADILVPSNVDATIKPVFSFTNSTTSDKIGMKAQTAPVESNITSKQMTSVGNLFAPSSFNSVSSQSTNINFNNYSNKQTVPNSTSNVKTDPTRKSDTNQIFNMHSTQFGTNTTVTSAFGTNTILSTGLEGNPSATTISSSDFSSTTPSFLKRSLPNTSPILSFDTNQTQTFTKSPSQEAGFKFSLAKSPTTSIFKTSSAGFGALNTNFTVPSSNASSGVIASNNMFSFIANTTKGPSPCSTSPEFVSPISGNAAIFTPTSTNNKSTSGSDAFGQSIFSGEVTAQKSVFGTTANNQNGITGSSTFDSNFKGITFDSNKNLFNTSTNASQPETFTIHSPHISSLTSGVFSFGSQPSSDINETAFGNSMATPVCGSSVNTISNITNTPFNPPGFCDNFTPKFIVPAAGIFNIGSGTSNTKSRTQLKARRRT